MPIHQEENYRHQYRLLKRKFKMLIYENECFQEELNKAQKTLLRIQRDKSFLLDRILQYQNGPETSSESDVTEESDCEIELKENKKRKFNTDSNSSITGNSSRPLKRKKGSVSLRHAGGKSNLRQAAMKSGIKSGSHGNGVASGSGLSNQEVQMSREEIERHLAARQPINDFPTTFSLTLPNQLFSDNLVEGDFLDEEADTSPSNVEDEGTVDSFD